MISASSSFQYKKNSVIPAPPKLRRCTQHGQNPGDPHNFDKPFDHFWHQVDSPVKKGIKILPRDSDRLRDLGLLQAPHDHRAFKCYCRPMPVYFFHDGHTPIFKFILYENRDKNNLKYNDISMLFNFPFSDLENEKLQTGVEEKEKATRRWPVNHKEGSLLLADILAGEGLSTQGGVADGVQEVCKVLVSSVFAMPRVGQHSTNNLPDHSFVVFLVFDRVM